MDRNTRIIDLTLGELEDWLFNKKERIEQEDTGIYEHGKYVMGLTGIMDLFGCSKTTAQKLKNTTIKDAVSQSGRLILVDVEKAKMLINNK